MWRGSGQVENIYTPYNFSHFAIYLPKFIKVSGNLTKFWHKQKCTVFLRHDVDDGLDVLCAQLTRDLYAIAKFFFISFRLDYFLNS